MANKFSDKERFSDHLAQFEQQVMLKYYSVIKGSDSEANVQIIPIRESKKLSEFQEAIGSSFQHPDVMAFNFYGCYKVSSYILRRVKALKDVFPDIKVVRTPVVFFNSIQQEFVEKYAPSLYPDFAEFKEMVVQLRWGER